MAEPTNARRDLAFIAADDGGIKPLAWERGAGFWMMMGMQRIAAGDNNGAARRADWKSAVPMGLCAGPTGSRRSESGAGWSDGGAVAQDLDLEEGVAFFLFQRGLDEVDGALV